MNNEEIFLIDKFKSNLISYLKEKTDIAEEVLNNILTFDALYKIILELDYDKVKGRGYSFIRKNELLSEMFNDELVKKLKEQVGVHVLSSELSGLDFHEITYYFADEYYYK